MQPSYNHVRYCAGPHPGEMGLVLAIPVGHPTGILQPVMANFKYCQAAFHLFLCRSVAYDTALSDAEMKMDMKWNAQVDYD